MLKYLNKHSSSKFRGKYGWHFSTTNGLQGRLSFVMCHDWNIFFVMCHDRTTLTAKYESTMEKNLMLNTRLRLN